MATTARAVSSSSTPRTAPGRKHSRSSGSVSSVSSTSSSHASSKPAGPVRRASGGNGAKNLPTSTVEYLKRWILSGKHFQNPYPNKEEKAKIMRDTGISMKQLKHWFVNNRRRFWRPSVEARLKELDVDDPLAVNLRKALSQVIGINGPKTTSRKKPTAVQAQSRQSKRQPKSSGPSVPPPHTSASTATPVKPPAAVSECDASTASSASHKEDTATTSSAATYASSAARHDRHRPTPPNRIVFESTVNAVSPDRTASKTVTQHRNHDSLVVPSTLLASLSNSVHNTSTTETSVATYSRFQSPFGHRQRPVSVERTDSSVYTWTERCRSVNHSDDTALPTLDEAVRLFGYC